MATILIVDDQPANRDDLVALLGDAGHHLLQAAGGAEALAAVKAERPDLVIAGIDMPAMNGFELVRQLRADPLIAQTPLIFSTAQYREREARDLARRCGVSTVIAKTSEAEAVLTAVEAALGLLQPPASFPAAVESGYQRPRRLPGRFSQPADDLRATNERLSALVDLNLQLASELDLRRLLRNFGHAARDIIGARYSVTGILDADLARSRSLYTSGMDAGTAAQLGSPDPGAGVLRTVLREGRSVRVQNPGGDPAALGFSASRPPMHSWLGAPIASPTRVYGYIYLIDKLGLDEFNKEDERLVGILAAQVGRIYQNGSQYSKVLSHAADLERELAVRAPTDKAVAQHVRQASLAAEVGAALTGADAVQELLQLSAEAVVRHLDVALARIWTFDDAQSVLELRASAGIFTHLDGLHTRVPIGELNIGRIALERRPYWTNEVDAGAAGADQEWAMREGMVAFAGYPLMVEQRLAGVVAMFARQPLETAALDALGSVAQQIALGIERHRAITERSAAEEALRARQEHIRLLLDSTAEAIYEIDLRGCCTFANRAAARMLGYADPSRLLGRNMHALMHHTRKDGTPYPREECKIFRAFPENLSAHVDDEVLWRADGSHFPAEYWSHPICRDGQVVGSVVTFLDVTERKQLEDQFRRAQQRLQDVVVSSPAVLFTLAIAHGEVRTITWISDNLEEILGYPPEVAIRPDWWLENVYPEDLERVQEQANTELFIRDRCTQEYRFRHGDGSYCWTRSDMRLIRDDTGRPSEVVGAWSDITERKRAEKEQSTLREQLQQARKLESVGRLAGGVAHDFNNLLTVVNGHCDLLLKQLTPAHPMHDSITEIRHAGLRAEALSRQLLLLSRRQVTQTIVVNLNDIVTEVENMLAGVIGEDIHLESSLSPSLGCVLADPGQLNQVLMNLAVNARDAMPAGGTLLIETRNVEEDSYRQRHAELKPGPYVQLTVSDTGVGMTKDVMSHLFEPFFTTKKPGEGTGLGLATVYGIVKQCGGSIWGYSEPGAGTTMTIHLPRVEARVDLRQERELEPAPPPLGGTETVLVVEDQEQLCKMAGRILRSYGYRVLEAADPEEALLVSRRYSGPIHLLLTDVVMPGMTGPELAGCMQPSHPDMKVVFMSGYSERALTDRLKLDGAYLAKPFSPELLATAVRGALGSQPSAGAILIVDDEPGIRKLLRKVLTGAGYQVLEAENGKEAVRRVETAEVDLVIMDLAMPEQEGIETIQLLRWVRPQLKIIAISGEFAGALLRAAEILGAQASLAKPIQPDELLDTVARVLTA